MLLEGKNYLDLSWPTSETRGVSYGTWLDAQCVSWVTNKMNRWYKSMYSEKNTQRKLSTWTVMITLVWGYGWHMTTCHPPPAWTWGNPTHKSRPGSGITTKSGLVSACSYPASPRSTKPPVLHLAYVLSPPDGSCQGASPHWRSFVAQASGQCQAAC